MQDFFTEFLNYCTVLGMDSSRPPIELIQELRTEQEITKLKENMVCLGKKKVNEEDDFGEQEEFDRWAKLL